MQRSRSPLKARDLMIAVVAFALALKLGIAYGHSPAYWREARFQGRMAASFRFYAAQFEKGMAPVRPEEQAEGTFAARKARELADRLERDRARYLWAAFLPWFPTAPDVPST
jgi:hypothetical protein